MDSNNTAPAKKNTELDIRDIANFLLSKLWIIALVVLCFAIIAFLWTSFFVTEEYTSTTEIFIINTSSSTTTEAEDWSIGKQLTKTSSELIMGDYCDKVAEALNKHNGATPETEADIALTKALCDDKIMNVGSSFSAYFSQHFGSEGITGSYIRNHIEVTSDDETCIVSVTATTENAKLSAAISNAVMCLFHAHINEFMQVDTIRTSISTSGTVPKEPSNANATRNAIIFGAIGAVLVCAILIIIFIFDDKVKTPDDIEKQLGLSVLGAIPEIDEA